MFDHAHFHRLFLVVSDSDLKAFRCRISVRLDRVVGPAPFAGEVEGIASVDLDSLIVRRVVDHVLAGNLDLPVVVAAIKADSPFGQRHAEMIGVGVHEFAHHPDFRI